MKIIFGSDHAGYKLKQALKEYIESKGFEVEDVGADSEDSTDYPDYAHPLALKIENGEADLGIAMCGSGNGISMALNKHRNIRAALCWNKDLATLARQHNNANVLSLPARFISEEEAKEIADAFLEAHFEGGRHERRVNKIACE